jgi:hypothetical protein
MTELTQAVREWLGGFENRGMPTLDRLCAGTGWGIFPQGRRLLARKGDICGKHRDRVRCVWLLKLACIGDGDTPWERLANWVSLAPPVLGENQVVSLEDGRLLSANAADENIYAARLIFDFDLEGVNHG